MFSFVLAIFLFTGTPGPGILTTAGAGAAFGFRKGIGYAVGVVCGATTVFLLVASGATALIFSVPYARTILLVASVAYLIYLAAKIAFAGANVAFISTNTPLRWHNGVLLSLINPKAYAVMSAMALGYRFLPENYPVEAAIKILMLLAISIPIHLAWLWAGAALRDLNLSHKQQRAINIAMASAMLLAVGLALLS